MGKSTLAQMLWQLAGGMGTSIQIFAVTLIFSLPLGLLVAVGRMSKNPIIRNLVKRWQMQQEARILWRLTKSR